MGVEHDRKSLTLYCDAGVRGCAVRRWVLHKGEFYSGKEEFAKLARIGKIGLCFFALHNALNNKAVGPAKKSGLLDMFKDLQWYGLHTSIIADGAGHAGTLAGHDRTRYPAAEGKKNLSMATNEFTYFLEILKRFGDEIAQ